MGYTTEFRGSFQLDKPLADNVKEFLEKLADTRRMKRNVEPHFGVQGEFYVDGTGSCGQGNEPNIIDYNDSPAAQPGLWLQWIPNEDGTEIEWDGGEKFYNYEEWLKYLIGSVLAPLGYTLNGTVRYRGEDFDDSGEIVVVDNAVNGCEVEVRDDILEYFKTINAEQEEEEAEKIRKETKLENIRKMTGFSGDLEGFKGMLRGLLEE